MFNPAEASRQIKREFIDYITTSDHFADERMNRSFRANLEKQLSKGPVVDIKDSFRPSKSIEDLIVEGVLSPEFRHLEAKKPVAHDGLYNRRLPLTRPLYAHQEAAVRRIGSGHSAIITTGTGSGKTECFLIPILNELLSQAYEGTLPDSGVQAILIYPMNALANDQIKRLRELLLCYPQIRFGVYSGDTKESRADALRKYRDLHATDRYEETMTQPIPNEIISREEMRENPPHILCTNYAMLEQLLLRPQDNDLFAKSDIRFVVLDEAHVYHGATGMETAYLLRRMKARMTSSDKVRYILTSATLGTPGESDQEILNFGHNLTGETFSLDDIIYGQRVEQQFTGTIDVPIAFFERIAARETDDDALTNEELRCLCEEFRLPYDDGANAAENLFDICYASSLYQKMRRNVHRPIELEEFSGILDLQQLQAIQFLHVLTQAYKNGIALVDVRYHFFVRALEGAYYAPGADDGEVWLTRKSKVRSNGTEYAAFELAVCADCGKVAIVGQEGEPDENGIRHIEPVAQYEKEKIRYFFPGDPKQGENIESDEINDEEEEAEQTENAKKGKKSDIKVVARRVCTICGSYKNADDGEPDCDCAGKKCITVFGFDEAKKRCACCGTGRMLRVFLPNHLATSVLGTSLFETLKPRKITENTDGVLRTREGGRQFLAFSDSRSEAAFFAPCLSQYYGDFLRRRGVANIVMKKQLEAQTAACPVIDLADDLRGLFVEQGTFNESLASVTDYSHASERNKTAQKNAWMAVLGAMLSAESRDSLTSFGFLQFSFRPNEEAAHKLAERYHVDDFRMKALLDHLIATAVTAGALTFKGKDSILLPDDKKYVFFSDNERELIEVATNTSRQNQIGWLPRKMPGKDNKSYRNVRQSYVMRMLGIPEAEAVSFLKVYYDWLQDKLNKFYRQNNMKYTSQLPLELFDILLPGHPEAHWYRCERCGRVTTHKWGDTCVAANCSGRLSEVRPEELQRNNHYANLYSKQMLKPLIIKEHTAQLSRSEGAKFQEDFEKNNINALSCSTTFEMGVDVGDLETVFLRDVPPSAANYAQRAGRAGRSKHAAAYALTYAKLSSHDFTFFDQPNKLIAGTIQPPIFKLYNEKILNRHIYAVVLAYLFRKDPAYYGDGRMQTFLDSRSDQELRALLDQRPAGLTRMLEKSFANAGDEVISYVTSYCWVENFIGEEGVLSATINEYRGTIKEYTDAVNELSVKVLESSSIGSAISRLMKQRELYQQERLIDMFSRNNVLPRYGFPVDTAELTPIEDGDKRTTAFGNDTSKLQMQRDLKMAISEYAPGAKVIAGGDMYTSRYVRKAFMGRGEGNDFHRGYVYCCDNCGAWNFNRVKKDPEQKCVQCGRTLDIMRSWESSIEPREGFFADFNPQKVPRERPSHAYVNSAAYIGDGSKQAVYRYSVSEHTVLLSSSSKDKILITSQRPFYICHSCGFGLGISDTVKNKTGRGTDKTVMKDLREGYKSFVEVEHKNTRGNACKCTTLYRERFHHIFETDVVRLEMDRYCASEAMQESVIYALLRALSAVLDVEENEIAACAGYSVSGLSVILYDTAAGGAGHIHRLLSKETLHRVLEKAQEIVEGCTCDTSCYSCLRSYNNQRIHEKLDRHLAADYLKSFAGECLNWERCEDNPEEMDKPVKPDIVTDYVLTKVQDGFRLYGSYDEIFGELEDEVEEEDIAILNNLADESGDMKYAPQAFGGMLLKAGSEEISPLLYWPEQKVMLIYRQTDEAIRALSDDGWRVVSLNDHISCKMINEMLGGNE